MGNASVAAPSPPPNPGPAGPAASANAPPPGGDGASRVEGMPGGASAPAAAPAPGVTPAPGAPPGAAISPGGAPGGAPSPGAAPGNPGTWGLGRGAISPYRPCSSGCASPWKGLWSCAIAARRIVGGDATGACVLGRTPGPASPAATRADGVAFEPAGWPRTLTYS